MTDGPGEQLEIPGDWVDVACPCGNKFQVPPSLKSGITNCPACKKAVEVPGGLDLGLAIAIAIGFLVWLVFTGVAYGMGGWTGALAVGAVLGAILIALLIAS